MNRFSKGQNNFLRTLIAPEMRVFWIFLPFLITIAIVNAFALDSVFLIALIGALVVVAGLIVFFYAVSLTRSNEAVKREQTQFEGIVLTLEDALIVYDQSFRILFFNRAAERVFNVRADAVLGGAVTPQDVQDPARRLLAQVIYPSLAPVMVNRSDPGAYPQVVEMSFDDPVLELRVITNAIVDHDGQPLGFMKMIRDRTRDVAILRSKNEFITVASHQLRTPITGINWALETLQGDKELGETNRVIVDSALEAGHQLLGIVEDLLMVSKIEEGRFGYHFASIDIIEFLNRILAAAIPQARSVGVQVYFDKPEGPLSPVVADHEKLTMVIENLLDNALRYNVKNGEIVVKVAPVEGDARIEVSVRDTGIGIGPQDIEKLFAKFYRGENALKFKTEGSGLGLYIAKNIVRAHGGKIWVESQLNRGTTFHFTLVTDMNLVPPKEVPLEF